MSANERKTFLITGVSSGMGRALSRAALAERHFVVGTVRSTEARISFEQFSPGLAHGRLLDMADIAAMAPLVKDIEKTVGPIDVLVNNAGYGFEGTIEESSMEDLRRQFDVNVFGPVALIQAVLPYMRRRRSGHIVNITSVGGFITFPGLGFYHGSKFALEGITESLAKEVKNLGIKVTAVKPGAFRTDWAGRSLARGERSISDYNELVGPLYAARRERDGKQPGDPEKAAKAILAVLNESAPPIHLLLGADAVQRVREKIGSLLDEIAAWERVSSSTNYGT